MKKERILPALAVAVLLFLGAGFALIATQLWLEVSRADDDAKEPAPAARTVVVDVAVANGMAGFSVTDPGGTSSGTIDSFSGDASETSSITVPGGGAVTVTVTPTTDQVNDGVTTVSCSIRDGSEPGIGPELSTHTGDGGMLPISCTWTNA